MTISHIYQLSLRSYSAQIESHQHDFAQLVLPVVGEIDLLIGTQHERVGRRRCAMIPAGTVHRFSAQQQAIFLVADMSPPIYSH